MKVRHKSMPHVIYDVLDEGREYYIVQYGDTDSTSAIEKRYFEPVPDSWEDVTERCTVADYSNSIGRFVCINDRANGRNVLAIESGEYRVRKVPAVYGSNTLFREAFIIERKVN